MGVQERGPGRGSELPKGSKVTGKRETVKAEERGPCKQCRTGRLRGVLYSVVQSLPLSQACLLPILPLHLGRQKLRGHAHLHCN